MADSGNKIGQFRDEMEQAASQLAKDVKDEVGQMIEQGVQSIAGPKLTPQSFDSAQDKQKQLDEQKRLAQARKTIKWYQDIALAQKKVREEEKQKKLQKQQQEEQEKQKKKLEGEEQKNILISPAKRKPLFPGQVAPMKEEIARTRQEIGKGHGVGG